MTARRLIAYGACGLLPAACVLPAIDSNYKPSEGVAGNGVAGTAGKGTYSSIKGGSTGTAGAPSLGGAANQGGTASLANGGTGRNTTNPPLGGGNSSLNGGASGTAVATTGGSVVTDGGAATAGALGTLGIGGTPSTSGGSSAPSNGGSGQAGNTQVGGSVPVAGAATTGGGSGSGGATTSAAGTAGLVGTAGATSNDVPLSIGAGYGHSCIVLADGNVWCWGNNTVGSLGNGASLDGSTEVTSLVPVQVVNVSQAIFVATGDVQSCAVTRSGEAKCWGSNSYGQLGNGSSGAWSSAPVDVRDTTGGSALTGAVTVAAGIYHTCALLGSGNVVCWGSGDDGRLGSGSNTSSTLPVLVSTTASASTPLTQATGISSTRNHTCAVRQDHSVYCWGLNDSGQLGDGTTTSSNFALLVKNIQATSVAAGDGHTCARITDGTVKCWGSGTSGQLGDGNGASSMTPVTVDFSDGAKVTAIAAGSSHNCAILDGATQGIRCWGRNYYGQLGDATDVGSNFPVDVKFLTNAVGIAAGHEHSCAYLATGKAYCWGDNWFGSLGDGNGGHGPKFGKYSTAPAQVTGI